MTGSAKHGLVIPGRCEASNPESRDSPMRNCASEVWSFGPSRKMTVHGMLRRGACQRARIRATRWLLAMTGLERAVDHDLDQLCSGAVECGFERGRDFLWLGDAHRLQAERFCEAGEVHRRIDKIHADVVVVAMERQQPLLDDAVAAIVDDHDRERQLVMRRGP